MFAQDESGEQPGEQGTVAGAATTYWVWGRI